jgi:hypothetical protein
MNKVFKVKCLTVEEIRKKFSQEIIVKHHDENCELFCVENYYLRTKSTDYFFVQEFDGPGFKDGKYYNIDLVENYGLEKPYSSYIPKDYVVPFSRRIFLFEDD